MALLLIGASAAISYYFYKKIEARDYVESGKGSPYVGTPKVAHGLFPLSPPLPFNCPDIPGFCQTLSSADGTWNKMNIDFATAQEWSNTPLPADAKLYYRWVWYNTYEGWNGLIFPYQVARPFALTSDQLDFGKDNGGPNYCNTKKK